MIDRLMDLVCRGQANDRLKAHMSDQTSLIAMRLQAPNTMSSPGAAGYHNNT